MAVAVVAAVTSPTAAPQEVIRLYELKKFFNAFSYFDLISIFCPFKIFLTFTIINFFHHT